MPETQPDFNINIQQDTRNKIKYNGTGSMEQTTEKRQNKGGILKQHMYQQLLYSCNNYTQLGMLKEYRLSYYPNINRSNIKIKNR